MEERWAMLKKIKEKELKEKKTVSDAQSPLRDWFQKTPNPIIVEKKSMGKKKKD